MAEMPGARAGEGLGRRHHRQTVFRKTVLAALWATARELRPEAGKTAGARGMAKTEKIRYLGGGMGRTWRLTIQVEQ